MLRPATPLSVLLFVAFALLLISVLSAPIIKGINLGSGGGVDYGVFGYCKGSTCSPINVGYPSSTGSSSSDNFSLPSSTRHSLSPLLIVHPIATLFNLILLILALTAHLHSPSHSPRFLLALLILTVPTFILSLLAFLIDILMFLPHLAWPGWAVLAATILLAASSVITCAMRRTLVSRKARKKRIAENAEMNGENFYSRQAPTPPPVNLDREPTAPMVEVAPGADKLPGFATFGPGQKSDGDDRISLNQRTPSNKSYNDTGMSRSDDGSERYGGPPRPGQPGGPGRGRGGYSGPRDEYGNPLPPSGAFGLPSNPRRNPVDPRFQNNMSPNRGPPPMGGRGRGGNGRGGYGGPSPPGPWPGPPNGPGGMGPNGVMGRGGPRGPPPAYNGGYGPSPQGRGGPYNREQSPYGGGYGRRPSPGPPGPGYGRGPSPGPPGLGYGRNPSPGLGDQGGYGGYGGRGLSPGPPMGPGGMRRGQSPPPPLPFSEPDDNIAVGQAIEMDATTGSPSPLHGTSPTLAPRGFGQYRDGDGGKPGLQIPRQSGRGRMASGAVSPTSVYSTQDPYVPPRAAWNEGRPVRTPLNTVIEPTGGSEISPVELPTPLDGRSEVGPHGHSRKSSDMYYEDVDPRFVDDGPVHAVSELPTSLSPGYGGAGYGGGNGRARNDGKYLQPIMTDRPSYEDLHDGARSPAASDISHYTSVSQRGVNPNWQPGPGQAAEIAPRRPQQQQRDMLLSNNQDFELPVGGRRGAAARGGRMPGMIPPAGGRGVGGAGGRYPGPNQI